MIGLRKECQGLYLLQAPTSQIALTALVAFAGHTSSTLWHSRLGHPSFSKLSLLNKIVSSEAFNNPDCCEVCHLSKQKRLPFPSSSHVFVQPFELVHCDL